MAPPLPELPKVELEVTSDRVESTPGFLVLRRVDLVAVRQAHRSAPFTYDLLDRRALDACVMVAHHESGGRVHVWLRSCVRPPVALRATEPRHGGVLWEVPAGLIEPDESPAAAAAREIEEELGFAVTEDALLPLGPWTVPAPGFVGEVHHYFHVRVDPSARRAPAGDGSPLEHAADVITLPLEEALEACRRGELEDAKTELALRRLADALSAGAR